MMVLLKDLCLLFVGFIHKSLLGVRDYHVRQTNRCTKDRCILETYVLDSIDELDDYGVWTCLEGLGDELLEILVSKALVAVVLEPYSIDLWKGIVEEKPSRSRVVLFVLWIREPVAVRKSVANLCVVRKASGFYCHLDFIQVVVVAALSLVVVLGSREVVDSKDHVLRRIDDRLSVCRVQEVGGAEHEGPALKLCSLSKRYVHCHLVSIEVGIECMTYERMELDCLSVHKDRLKGLDSKSMERRCSVEHDRMLLDNLVED